MRWFRFYDEVLDDPKVRLLHPALAWSWVLILCAANRHEPRGTVPPLSDLSFLLRVNPQKTRMICERLREAGLLEMDDEERTFLVHNWDVRQREYDLSTRRTKTFRERSGNMPDTEEIQKQNQRRGDITLGEREFILPDGLLARWVTAYPAVDVSGELRAAFEWAQANPANHKSNWQRFLAAWLKRSQDRAPRVVSAPTVVKIRPAILDEPPPFSGMESEDDVFGPAIRAVAAGKKMP